MNSIFDLAKSNLFYLPSCEYTVHNMKALQTQTGVIEDKMSEENVFSKRIIMGVEREKEREGRPQGDRGLCSVSEQNAQYCESTFISMEIKQHFFQKLQNAFFKMID